MPAPMGHAPYNVNGEGGRPVIYDDEFIEKQAELFLEWLKQPTNILFKKFALQQGYHPNRLQEFADKNVRFSGVLNFAKAWQEIKLGEGGLTKEYSGDFTKFILINHHDYADKTQQTISGDPDNPLGPYLVKANGKSKNLVDDDSTP